MLCFCHNALLMPGSWNWRGEAVHRLMLRQHRCPGSLHGRRFVQELRVSASAVGAGEGMTLRATVIGRMTLVYGADAPAWLTMPRRPRPVGSLGPLNRATRRGLLEGRLRRATGPRPAR